MNINFKNTPYLSAVKETPDLDSESKIFKYAKKDLQFKYVDVTVQKFNEKYSTKGWLGRKVIALPAVIWSGIVKTIYHLAQAIIIGSLKAFSDNGKYFQSKLFYIGRDAQESLGWLISLFNDRYGQYHIQESEFHKTCYDCFFANEVNTDVPSLGSSHSSKRDLDKEIDDLAQINESRLAELANAAFNEGNKEKALETIKDLCHDTNTKEAFIAKIAVSYYEEGNLDAALETIKLLVLDTDTKESFITKIANSYYDKRNPEAALETIKLLVLRTDNTTKESFITKIADSYYDKGDLDKALKTIELLILDTDTRESFTTKIAGSYCHKGDLDEALKTIKLLNRNTNTRESLIIKIAEDHYADDNRQTALETLGLLCYDYVSKDSLILKELLIIKIANSYYKKREFDKAHNAILGLRDDIQTRKSFIAKIENA